MTYVDGMADIVPTISHRFDSSWYKSNYNDVELLSMDPENHYMTYGHVMGRDPNPDFSTKFMRMIYGLRSDREPVSEIARLFDRSKLVMDQKSVLEAANILARMGKYEQAIKLAEIYIPRELLHTVNLLRANNSVIASDRSSWIGHVNNYLSRYNVSPIGLIGSGSFFDCLDGGRLKPVKGGPLVTVIMPAWNAEKTVRKAATSILSQTWQNLELIIVDDASSDGTWKILKEIAEADKRVKIQRNSKNVGPYVSKNFALSRALGEYITGHDADDWALPQRIEKHLDYMLKESDQVGASLARMLRMRPDGEITSIKKVSVERFDGAMQIASISCMFRGDFLRNKLGYWDCVRFGGDSELIKRAETVLGRNFHRTDQMSMFCLDIESSLSNHPSYGIDRNVGIQGPRLHYREGYLGWHRENISAVDNYRAAYLPFPQEKYRTDVPLEARISFEDIKISLINCTEK